MAASTSTDGVEPQLRHGLGDRRLAPHAVPADHRPGEVSGAAAAGGRRSADDLREQLHQGDLPRRGPAARGVHRVREGVDRREVPHRTAARCHPRRRRSTAGSVGPGTSRVGSAQIKLSR